MAAKIAVTCAALRNLAIEKNEPDDLDDVEDEYDPEMSDECEDDGSDYPSCASGKALMKWIIEELF